MVLFTLSEFKEFEGIVGTQHDALIPTLALRASAAIDNYTKRTIEAPADDYTEEVDGSGVPTILVRNPPIRSVTSIHISPTRDWASATAEPAADFVFDNSGVITRVQTTGVGSQLVQTQPLFPKGVRNVRVIYAGGFATIPLDLRQAAIMLASYWMGRRRSVGIQSSTIGSSTQSWQSRQWPMEVTAILNGYVAHKLEF